MSEKSGAMVERVARAMAAAFHDGDWDAIPGDSDDGTMCRLDYLLMARAAIEDIGVMTIGDGRETQPSARALEYAHDVRWPDDRVDLARLCKEYGDERAREATEAERRRRATIDHIDIDLIRREARAAAIEECANFVDSQEVLREHSGMSAVENMSFLLESTAEEIRALVSERGAEE